MRIIRDGGCGNMRKMRKYADTCACQNPHAHVSTNKMGQKGKKYGSIMVDKFSWFVYNIYVCCNMRMWKFSAWPSLVLIPVGVLFILLLLVFIDVKTSQELLMPFCVALFWRIRINVVVLKSCVKHCQSRQASSSHNQISLVEFFLGKVEFFREF